MASFTITNMAKDGLRGIARYTLSKWGRDQRNHYLSMLDSCFHQLAANPLKGKDCSDIRSGYRKFNVGSHIIFYRPTLPRAIEIVRILHEHMDVETRIVSS